MTRKKITVLVAEDQAINRALIVQLLQKSGLRCDIAENGLEAVEACRHKRYNLVLMDVQMPVMDGLEATRQIRKMKGIHQPKIAAMTAHAMNEDRERCLAAGMDVYFSKPIHFEDIIALIKEEMSEAGASLDG